MINVRVGKSGFPLGRRVEKMLKSMREDFHDEVKDLTPRGKTGNAKAGWRKTSSGTTNDVPYIGVLDEGRKKASHRRGMQGSTQAPDGMTNPALNKVIAKYRNKKI